MRLIVSIWNTRTEQNMSKIVAYGVECGMLVCCMRVWVGMGRTTYLRDPTSYLLVDWFVPRA